MRLAIFTCLAISSVALGQSPLGGVSSEWDVQKLSAQPDEARPVLDRVAECHGSAGVFAVVGYSMGQRALHELGEARGSFDLEVTHRTPMKVQYSCVADGVQASTGVSAGKLNLDLVEAPVSEFETIFRDRKTGKQLVFRIRPPF